MTIAVVGLLLALVGAWPAPARADGGDPAPSARLEGAIGLVARLGPSDLGASPTRLDLRPGGFVRWRWLTLTGSGGFTTRSREVVEGGLAVQLPPADGFRLRLGLSVDSGRQASDRPEWAGLGDIEPTVRGRLSLSWTPRPAWQVTAQASTDLLDRGGGILVHGALSRRWDRGLQDHVSAGLSLTWADAERNVQRFGIDPRQSLSSGRPVFLPGAGWQQLNVQISWRGEFQIGTQPYGAFASISQGLIVGDVAHSPLVQRRRSAGVAGGLAWRF